MSGGILRWFLIFTFLTLFYAQVLRSFTAELDRRVPGGIVTLELAGIQGEADEILSCLEGRGEARNLLPVARLQLWLDFGFLLLYPVAIALGCLLARRRLAKWGWLAAAGLLLARSQAVAGLFDLGENLALLRVVALYGRDPSSAVGTWATVAGVLAALKFLLVGFGLAYALLGFIRWLTEEVGPYGATSEGPPGEPEPSLSRP